eukprot:7053722-Prymnesium_polylepis.1
MIRTLTVRTRKTTHKRATSMARWPGQERLRPSAQLEQGHRVSALRRLAIIGTALSCDRSAVHL